MSDLTLPEAQRLEAKQLFFIGHSMKEIAERINVSEATLSRWAKDGKWYVERFEEHRQYVEERLGQTTKEIADLITITIPVISTSIQKLAEQVEETGKPLGPYALAALTTVVTDLQKLVRLELNKPTDIVKSETTGEIKPMSVKQLKEILSKDPFIEAEFKHVHPAQSAQFVESGNSDETS